jgi:hypothetical protein
MSVYFKCKSCQEEHSSPAGFFDTASFDASPMREALFTCQGTGRTNSYVRKDMYWRDDAER